jgi:hypothetical protein
MRRIIVVFTTLLMSGPWLSVAQTITAQEGNTSRDRQEYESQTSGNYSNGNGIVSVDTDKWVSWNGPDDSTVFMQTDDQTPLFFASGSSGVQGAPWMVEGHVYTFILQDADGTEIAWARFKPDRTP